jgi:hypothetical protein
MNTLRMICSNANHLMLDNTLALTDFKEGNLEEMEGEEDEA